MQKSIENVELCQGLISDFKVLQRDQPRDPEVFDKACRFLLDTLLNACSRPDIAEEIAGKILQNEDRFPVPATVRRYLRENDYIEADESARRDAKNRAGQKPPEPKPEPVYYPMDLIFRIGNQLSECDRKAFMEELRECPDNETEEVIRKYKDLLARTKSAMPLPSPKSSPLSD